MKKRQTYIKQRNRDRDNIRLSSITKYETNGNNNGINIFRKPTHTLSINFKSPNPLITGSVNLSSLETSSECVRSEINFPKMQNRVNKTSRLIKRRPNKTTGIAVWTRVICENKLLDTTKWVAQT